MFLGRPVGFCLKGSNNWDGLLGRFPQAAIDDEADAIAKDMKEIGEIQSQYKTSQNAEKGYRRSREAASKESMEKAKEIDIATCAIHPLFGDDVASRQVSLRCVRSKVDGLRTNRTFTFKSPSNFVQSFGLSDHLQSTPNRF